MAMKKVRFQTRAALATESKSDMEEVAIRIDKGIPFKVGTKTVILQVIDNGDGTFSPKFTEVL